MKRSISFLAQNFALALFQFAYLILVSRIFAPSDFAYYMSEFALITLLTTIGSAGFTQIVFSEHSSTEKFIARMSKRAVKSGLVLFAMGQAAVVPWFLLWQVESSWLEMASPMLVLIITPIYNLFVALIRANYKTLVSVTAQLASFFSGYTLAVILCYFTENKVFLFAAQAISQLALVAIQLALSRRESPTLNLPRSYEASPGENIFVKRARQLSLVSYVSTNLFRWSTTVSSGTIGAGQLNRSEAFTAGPIGLFQNSFTTSISSLGNKGTKLYSQGDSYTSKAVQIYAFSVLAGSGCLSFGIAQIMSFALGQEWLFAAELSANLLVAWAGYSVISVASYVCEIKREWSRAFTLQITSLLGPTIGSATLWLSKDLNLSTLVLCSLNIGTAIFATIYASKKPFTMPKLSSLNFFGKATLVILSLTLLTLFGLSLYKIENEMLVLAISLTGTFSSAATFLAMSKKL